MTSIFVGIPCATAKAYTGHIISLIKLSQLCKDKGIDFTVYYENAISIIHHARNKIVKQFLDSNFDILLFIDDDIEFNPEDILKMINYIETGDHDIIGGIYPYKYYNWQDIRNGNNGLNFVFTNPPENIHIRPMDTPQEVDGIGTGYMMISKRVFTKMINTGTSIYEMYAIQYYKFFDIVVENEKLNGEDYFFCKKWKELGGKIEIISTALAIHWGAHQYGKHTML